MTSPVIRCLKQQTKAEVHFLTKAGYKELLTANPYIDQLITINKEITEVTHQLKQEKYDAIIDLHHNLRTTRLGLSLGIKRHSFPKLNVEKWLLTNFKINRLPDRHVVDRYFETVQSFQVQNDGQGLDYFIPEQQEVNLSATGLPEQYISIAIGGKYFTKRLPEHKVIAVIEQLKLPVVLLGGPEDSAAGQRIAAALPDLVTDGCGQFSVNQSASLIRQSACLITNDTGMMHIGAALKRPVVSVWGNTVPKLGMTPYFPEGRTDFAVIEDKSVGCRPCSKLGYGACPKGHFACMENLDINNIAEQANRLI